MAKIGILLTNTGTPDAPTPKAVRRYLRQFLSDTRVIHLPHLIWLPILYGLVLPFRAKSSAKLYQKIWLEDSPMRLHMQTIVSKLQKYLANNEVIVTFGMHYGNPSIPQALKKLQQAQVKKIIILPLFPQYSNTSTASSFDRVVEHLKSWPHLPEISFIDDYADQHKYAEILANSVQQTWKKRNKAEHLLISFHGIPQRMIKKGDPYYVRCTETAALMAAKLNLSQNQWTLCFQSQFGYDKWLQPSTQTLFMTLPQQGIKNIDVICPGFAVDCLETLEEIAIRGKESFLRHGGESLQYIPALNADDEHIQLLSELISV